MKGCVNMNYFELATKRKSTRDFKDKEVSESLMAKIKAYFMDCKRLVPAIKVEFRIIDPKLSPMMNGCVGYKDYLIEAPHYLLILSEKADRYIENAGFIGEDIVLKMTDMDIDTCWITISDSKKLKERLNLNTDMEPAALIAFGYEKATLSLKRLDIVNQSNVTMKKRSGYEAPKLYIEDAIYAEDMGIKEENSTLDHYTDLYQALVAACCAPSFLNLQPYRFIIDDGLFILVSLEHGQTSEEDQALNLGILMLNFYAVLSQRSGVYGKWELKAPEKALELPEGGEIVGYFKI